MKDKAERLLDAQLDYWAATDAEQRAERDRRSAERAKHPDWIDRWDASGYLRRIREGGWNR